MDADIQALRDQFLNKSFDEKSFNIDPAVSAVPPSSLVS